MKNHNDKLVWYLLSGLIFILISLGYGQNKEFTYSDVYGGGQSKIMGEIPSIEGWLDKNSYLIWQQNDENKKIILEKIDAESGDVVTWVDFSPVHDRFITSEFYSPWETHTADYLAYIIRDHDDLYYFSARDQEIRRLTKTDAKEKNPTFSPDGRQIAFTRDHDLYSINIESGEETRLTFDGTNLVYNGYASWVYYEEILGRRSKYKSFWWAPNSEMISYLRFDDTNVPEFPIFHCEGVNGFLEIQRYPKPGDPNPTVKLGVTNIKNGRTIWIDSSEKSDVYIAWPFWTPDSKNLIFQKVNREQNKISLHTSDLNSGLSRLLFTESQSTWINFFNDLYLLEDGDGFLLRSDVSGWRHLYHYDMEGNLITQLTKGEWNVDKLMEINEEDREVYFQGFKDNSLETHLFMVNLDGSDLRKITRTKGTHTTKVSPDGNFIIDSFSTTEHAAKTILINKSGETIRLLGNKHSSELEQYNLGKTELFKIPVKNGIELPALWVLPPGFDKSKKYPVIFQVYGGPGRANVKNQFRSLANQYLAQNDIIIFTVDHRGSYHFGKEGQSKMHRNLGKWEMNDYIEAVKWLQKSPFVDKNRIGIMGGSYGGYVAAMALTYGSEYFTHGVALYSVTDWRLYDNFYTERFMDRPDENPDGYEFGSVMTHAEKYKGKLLIVHGALDDNVHMQNTTQLIQVLQKLDKSFELMIYPNQKHGARGAWKTHANRETVNFWFRHFLNRELNVKQ